MMKSTDLESTTSECIEKLDVLLSQANPPLRQRRQRTNFDETALLSLENEFMRNPYPDINERDQIASRFATTEDRIQVWFQNKRARYRKRMQKENKQQKQESTDNAQSTDLPVCVFDEAPLNATPSLNTIEAPPKQTRGRTAPKKSSKINKKITPDSTVDVDEHRSKCNITNDKQEKLPTTVVPFFVSTPLVNRQPVSRLSISSDTTGRTYTQSPQACDSSSTSESSDYYDDSSVASASLQSTAQHNSINSSGYKSRDCSSSFRFLNSSTAYSNSPVLQNDINCAASNSSYAAASVETPNLAYTSSAFINTAASSLSVSSTPAISFYQPISVASSTLPYIYSPLSCSYLTNQQQMHSILSCYSANSTEQNITFPASTSLSSKPLKPFFRPYAM